MTRDFAMSQGERRRDVLLDARFTVAAPSGASAARSSGWGCSTRALRDIDRIATDALKRASRKKLKRVDRKLLESAFDIDELE